MRKHVMFAILLSFLISTAMAATVSISPEKIDPGDTVTVDVKGLSDGDTFSLSIGGEFDVNPGEEFAFIARNLNLPFSLDSGEVSAYTRGTSWTGLSARKGGTEYALSGDAIGGEYSATQPYSITSGKYEAITLNGRAASSTTSIVSEMTMKGTKRGESDGKISFALEGIKHGTATIAVHVGGSEALSKKIAIGSPSSSGSTGSSGGSSSSSSPSQPYPQDPTPPGATTSADGRVSLTGADVGGTSLLSRAVEGTFPAGWSMAGRAYAVTPADHTFTPRAVISFPAPATTASIARLENGNWVIIPSKIEDGQIAAEITEGGSYTVLIPEGAPAQPTTSVVTATTAPPATTTTPAATPLPALLPALACAILILVQSRRG